MFEFVQLVRERDKIIASFQKREQVDFSGLRNICRDFNRRCVVESVFETDSTDQQLWESVINYFQKLREKS